MSRRRCKLCGRTMSLHWWNLAWLLGEPPPVCRRDKPQCHRLLAERHDEARSRW